MSHHRRQFQNTWRTLRARGICHYYRFCLVIFEIIQSNFEIILKKIEDRVRALILKSRQEKATKRNNDKRLQIGL